MSIVRARELALWIVLAAAVAGCASVGSYNSEAPPSVDLSGSWVMNREASEDPKPVFDKLRPKYPDNSGLPPDDTVTDDGQPTGGQQGQRGRHRQAAQIPSDAGNRYNDSFQRTSVSNMLRADIARGEQMTITQKPDQFSLDYGAGVRSFTPGAKSVVGASWGVADQSSGWKGKSYVIATKPQTGVASIETFSLSKDGRQLIEELELGGGGGFPAAKLKLLYDRSDKPLPRSLPLSD